MGVLELYSKSLTKTVAGTNMWSKSLQGGRGGGSGGWGKGGSGDGTEGDKKDASQQSGGGGNGGSNVGGVVGGSEGESKGGDTCDSPPPPPTLRCPKQHILVDRQDPYFNGYSTKVAGFECSVCGVKYGFGSRSSHCAECEFDCCVNCTEEAVFNAMPKDEGVDEGLGEPSSLLALGRGRMGEGILL
jgi:hypothetical protein